MVDELSAYLRAAAAERFHERQHNCMLWVADWVLSRTGIDPAAAWRAAVQIPLGYGGVVLLNIDVLKVATIEMAHFSRAAAPVRGDVGVVLAPRPTAAICTGRRWAALGPQGLACAAWWPVRRAWTVPHA